MKLKQREADKRTQATNEILKIPQITNCIQQNNIIGFSTIQRKNNLICLYYLLKL